MLSELYQISLITSENAMPLYQKATLHNTSTHLFTGEKPQEYINGLIARLMLFTQEHSGGMIGTLNEFNTHQEGFSFSQSRMFLPRAVPTSYIV